MRRPLDRDGEPKLWGRQAAVLAFFQERLGALAIELDDDLGDHGLATADGVVLGPSALDTPAEASILAHELFHVWCRREVPPDQWRGLSCAVPALLADGSVEEIATDLLAQRLCAQAEKAFLPTYLVVHIAPDVLEVRLDLARRAVKAAAKDASAIDAVMDAQRALRLLSGQEIYSVALLELGLRKCGKKPRWPPLLEREVAGPRDEARKLIEALAGPQLLAQLCRTFSTRGWNEHRRGPLWQGDSRIEGSERLLRKTLATEDLSDWFATVLERIEAARP